MWFQQHPYPMELLASSSGWPSNQPASVLSDTRFYHCLSASPFLPLLISTNLILHLSVVRHDTRRGGHVVLSFKPGHGQLGCHLYWPTNVKKLSAHGIFFTRERLMKDEPNRVNLTVPAQLSTSWLLHQCMKIPRCRRHFPDLYLRLGSVEQAAGYTSCLGIIPKPTHYFYYFF